MSVVTQNGSIKEFFWFINERQRIYLAKESGKMPPPWTEDEILQKYFFCNVFREQDKTTRYIHKNFRLPIIKRAPKKKMPAIMIFNMALCRFFNYIPTLEFIGPIGLPPTTAQKKQDIDTSDWDMFEEALAHQLRVRQDEGHKIFSDAYLVAGTDLKGKNKINGVIDRLHELWGEVDKLGIAIPMSHSLEDSWRLLCHMPGIGPFIAYEIVTDLRHTPVLDTAQDIMTWANAGPGALRGLQRIYGLSITKNDCLKGMKTLLGVAQIDHQDLNLEMRDIEHCLCEYDKYKRIQHSQGVSRRYRPS